MLHADEIRKGADQLQYVLATLQNAHLQPKRGAVRRNVATAETLRPYELNLNGSQVLLWVLAGATSLGLFVWALIRLWLFGQ